MAAKIIAGVLAEIDRAKMRPAPVVPSAMIPGTDHDIVPMPGVLWFGQLIDLLGSISVLLIPPAGHVQVGHGGLLQVWSEGLFLPEDVVVGMLHEIVPCRYLPVKISLVDVRQGTETQVPLVSIIAVEREMDILRLAAFQHGCVFEAITEPESAVVVEVVAQELIGRRGLFGNRLQVWVWMQKRHGGEPASVGGTEHSNLSVVVGDMMDEPIDGVIGIGGLIYSAGLIGGLPKHNEFAFGSKAPANVLVNENVAIGREGLNIRIRPEDPRIVNRSVGRARQQDRQRASISDGPEDYRVQ